MQIPRALRAQETSGVLLERKTCRVKAEVRGTCLQAKERCGLPEAGRGKDGPFPSVFRGSMALQTPYSGCQVCRGTEPLSLVVKPPNVPDFVSGPGKLHMGRAAYVHESSPMCLGA